MSKVWFIFVNDRHVGPFSHEDIALRFKSGKIDGNTLMWKEGEPTWSQMKSIEEFHTLLGIKKDPEPKPQEVEIPEEEVVFVSEPEFEPEPEVSAGPEPVPEPEVEPESEPEIDDVLPDLPVEEIEEDLSVEDELPPLPVEELPEEQPQDELPPVPVEEEVEAPEIPTTTESTDEISEDVEEVEEQEIIDEEPPEEIQEVLEAEGNAKKRRFIQVALGLASLVVIALWAAFFLISGDPEIPGKGLSSSDYKRLVSATVAGGDKLRFELALSKDEKYFVLTTNYNRPATIYLTLTSLNGKVLAEESVQISSISQLENRVAVFTDLRLEDSDKIVKGLYMLKIRGLDTSLQIKFLKFVRNLEIFNFIKYIREVDDRFQYRGEYVLGFPNHYSFQSALKDYKDAEKRKQRQPVQEVLQRYRTYYAMLQRLNELFAETLKDFNKRGSVKSFELIYAREIAPLYQTLTVENQKIQISLIESNTDLSQEYQKLVSFGKQIGILVTEMTERLNKYRKLKKKTRLKVLREFQGKLNELEELGKMRIHKIEEKLSSL